MTLVEIELLKPMYKNFLATGNQVFILENCVKGLSNQDFRKTAAKMVNDGYIILTNPGAIGMYPNTVLTDVGINYLNNLLTPSNA